MHNQFQTPSRRSVVPSALQQGAPPARNLHEAASWGCCILKSVGRVQLRCQWDISPAQESWVASSVFIGMMFGSYTWGALSDAYGRRIGFLAPACFTALFGVASAFSPSYGVRACAAVSALHTALLAGCLEPWLAWWAKFASCL